MSLLFLVGVDEAGRGPLAGPVTAAAVVLPVGYENSRIADSKLLSSVVRDELYEAILAAATAWACVSVGPRRIEQLNIRRATQLAMELAVAKLDRLLQIRFPRVPLQILIDGNMRIGTVHPQETIIGGDRSVLSISAASIVAKVTRDRLMAKVDAMYPGYEFLAHKGYPTELHRSRIRLQGPCTVHRRTFSGVREYLTPRGELPPGASAVCHALAEPIGESG